MPISRNGFWAGPFCIDGKQEGLGFWDYSVLSEKWIERCRSLISCDLPVIDRSLPGNLSHIHVKLTDVGSGALLTLSESNHIASSVLLLSGLEPEKDREVAKSFVRSLRRVKLVMAASQSDAPFRKILEIGERPLMVLVPWGDECVDYELINELQIHISAAFFSVVIDHLAAEQN